MPREHTSKYTSVINLVRGTGTERERERERKRVLLKPLSFRFFYQVVPGRYICLTKLPLMRRRPRRIARFIWYFLAKFQQEKISAKEESIALGTVCWCTEVHKRRPVCVCVCLCVCMLCVGGGTRAE